MGTVVENCFFFHFIFVDAQRTNVLRSVCFQIKAFYCYVAPKKSPSYHTSYLSVI